MRFFQTKHKWLLVGIYKPPKQDNSEFLEITNIFLNDYTETDIKEIIDSKTFWKIVKPNFNEKGSSSSKIILSQKGSILNGNNRICNTVNDYFVSIMKPLNLKPYKCSNTKNINEIISTFDHHTSFNKIKEYFPDAFNNNFEFTEVFQDEVKNEFLHLNVKNSSTSTSIPATILKQPIEIHLSFLINSINYSIKNGECSGKLRKSAVILLYKKEDLLKKENYGSVSLLLHASKVFERIIYGQINSYM